MLNVLCYGGKQETGVCDVYAYSLLDTFVDTRFVDVSVGGFFPSTHEWYQSSHQTASDDKGTCQTLWLGEPRDPYNGA